MSYNEEFQKVGRALRPRRKAVVKFMEMSKKGGAHEDKFGKNAKRAIRNRLNEQDIEAALDDWDDE